jgi:hypothetical protein
LISFLLSQAALPANFILGKLLVKLQDNFNFVLLTFLQRVILCASTAQAALRNLRFLGWPQRFGHILYDFGKSGTPDRLIEATAIFDHLIRWDHHPVRDRAKLYPLR